MFVTSAPRSPYNPRTGVRFWRTPLRHMRRMSNWCIWRISAHLAHLLVLNN
jgi:hypothetical protein